MKKITTMILALTMTLAIFTTASSETILNDIKVNDWFYNDVKQMIDLGVVDGYPDNTFKPQGDVKVDEFIKMLIIGMGYTTTPTDSTYWADEYIVKAEELKIVDKTFINDYRYNLTREQAARIIVNALSLKESRPSNSYAEHIKKAMYDYPLIADKHKQDMIDCYSWGIMQGNRKGEMKPKDTITRAEATTVLLRMMNKDRRLSLDFEAKSISGYNADGEYNTLIAPLLDGKPVNEMIDVAYILQEQIEKSKGAENFGVGKGGVGIGGYETIEKQEFVLKDWEDFSDAALAGKYTDFHFSVDFLDYKGINKPYQLNLWKHQGRTVADIKYQYQFDKYCEYFMEYYKEPFYEIFKLLFEDEVKIAWEYFETALKNQDIDHKTIETVINERNFFIRYDNSYINMIISLKGQTK